MPPLSLTYLILAAPTLMTTTFRQALSTQVTTSRCALCRSVRGGDAANSTSLYSESPVPTISAPARLHRQRPYQAKSRQAPARVRTTRCRFTSTAGVYADEGAFMASASQVRQMQPIQFASPCHDWLDIRTLRQPSPEPSTTAPMMTVPANGVDRLTSHGHRQTNTQVMSTLTSLLRTTVDASGGHMQRVPSSYDIRANVPGVNLGLQTQCMVTHCRCSIHPSRRSRMLCVTNLADHSSIPGHELSQQDASYAPDTTSEAKGPTRDSPTTYLCIHPRGRFLRGRWTRIAPQPVAPLRSHGINSYGDLANAITRGRNCRRPI
jgi:hypothetical protein